MKFLQNLPDIQNRVSLAKKENTCKNLNFRQRMTMSHILLNKYKHCMHKYMEFLSIFSKNAMSD